MSAWRARNSLSSPAITPPNLYDAAGYAAQIHAALDRKLEEARRQRQLRRQHLPSSMVSRLPLGLR